MYETAKLRGRIVEKFGTIKEFSREAGSSMSFISQYLNGKKLLDQKTIDRWANVLDIPASEYDLYFFARKVHVMEQ